MNTPAGPLEWPITDEEAESLFDAAALLVAEREPCNPTLLTAFAEISQRLREDRDTAPERVNRLLDMDPSGWRPLLQHEPSYCTVGVVEGILASVEKTAHLTWRCFELTTLATEIVPLLDESWPVVIRAQVSSEAWREHAWALLNLGRYPAAEDAARRARAQIADHPSLAIDGALAQYVEATAVLRQRRHDDALPLARTAAETFLDFGDKKRYVKARVLEGYALYEAQRLQESTDLWVSLLTDAKAMHDSVTLAYLYNNLGNAQRNLGKNERARRYFGRALALFEVLGQAYAQEIPRVRLGLARISLQDGQFATALAQMEEARRLFARLQMGSGVAAAELDIVEVLIVMRRVHDAERVCRELPSVFREFGMTRNELEAAAFLNECAAEKRLHVAHVRHVREYLRDLPQNPGRPFARPQVEVEG
jgi:tetratricopeptide (TPR) repeat protein